MKRFAVFLCAAFAAARVLAAGGSVTGTVVDRDGPVVGAVVALIVSEAGPAPKAVITGADGRYTFTGVTAGTYNVSASFSGGDPVSSLPFTVADGKAVEVAPISLEVETVEVNAKTDDVPTTGNTTTGETFQAEKLQAIPTARSYTEVLKIAPGVSEDTSGSNSSTAPAGISVYGSSAQESSYIIDGVNTTSIDTGRPSTNINYDLIDKIEIKTGGYNAEFGGAQGAVVNVTTKTGTNDFEGSVNLLFSPDQLASQPETNEVGTELARPGGREISATLGGPIVKNKAYFFTAISSRVISGLSPQRYLDLLNSGQPGTGRTVAEDSDSSGLYSAKVTWQVSPSNRLTATFFSDPRSASFRDELGGYGGDYDLKSGTKSAAIDFQSILATRWVLAASAGVHQENSETAPTIDRRAANPIGADRRLSYQSIRLRIDDSTSAGGGAQDISLKSGPYAYSGETDGGRRFLRTSLEGSFRKHTPKFGLELEPSDFQQKLDYGYGTGIAMEWSEATSATSTQPEQLVGIRRCWGDGNGACLDWNHQVDARAKTSSMRAYAQDQWRLTDSLTVNYGLRWDSQTIQDADGKKLVSINDSFAPRLGFTWDVVGTGTSRLYGSAGRYYDSVPLQVMSRAFAPRITMTRLYRTRNWAYQDFVSSFNVGPDQSSYGLCATNTPADDFNVPTCWDFESADLVSNPTQTSGFVDKVYSPNGLLNSGNPRGLFRPEVVVNSGSLYRSPIDQSLKGASTDEVMIGYDWTFLKSWTVGARMIGRRLNDAIEDLSLDLGHTFVIGNPGGPYHFYVDPQNPDLWNPNYDPTSTAYSAKPGLGQLYGCAVGTTCTVTSEMTKALGFGAIPKAERKFKGYELSLNKQLTEKFWFAFSYLYSSTQGNYRGRYFSESEERDPNQTEAFDVPALAVNTYGKLPQDRPHQVKAYGSYRVTSNLSLSGTLRWMSGTPIDATTDPLGGSTPFLGPIYLLPRGSAGRTPNLTNMDLGLSYDVRDSKKIKLTFMADVFNVLNEQKATRVDSQFLAAGMWRGAFYDPTLGFIFQDEGRGEPYDKYVDVNFGNGDGVLTPDEWNRWAGSFQGAAQNLDQLYQYLRTATVTQVFDGVPRAVPAYPGFQNCPVARPSDPSLCPALNSNYGKSIQLEAPRTIRLGVRLTF